MRLLMLGLTAVLAFTSTGACAGYDQTWFKWQSWSGEYPKGFAATKPRTVLMGRAAMDKDLPRGVTCELPYRGVIHPWNRIRTRKSQIKFYSFTKIIRLRAKEDFEFEVQGDDGTSVKQPIKKGDVIEYVHPLQEDFFQVRINGKQQVATEDLFEHVDHVANTEFVEDDWALLTCENGVRAYIYVPDAIHQALNEPDNFVREIKEVGPGMPGYGKARDLTEKEAAELAPKQRK
jgi:hypothetical protein